VHDLQRKRLMFATEGRSHQTGADTAQELDGSRRRSRRGAVRVHGGIPAHVQAQPPAGEPVRARGAPLRPSSPPRSGMEPVHGDQAVRSPQSAANRKKSPPGEHSNALELQLTPERYVV
jgi:hypothetical protein